MFEKAPPVAPAHLGEFVGDFGPRGGDALRMIAWSELTARLNAARDLRHMLQRDARLNIEASSATFADAAARYFRTRDECEPDVNPVVLEARKGSAGNNGEEEGADHIVPANQGHAETGDARDI